MKIWVITFGKNILVSTNFGNKSSMAKLEEAERKDVHQVGDRVRARLEKSCSVNLTSFDEDEERITVLMCSEQDKKEENLQVSNFSLSSFTFFFSQGHIVTAFLSFFFIK